VPFVGLSLAGLALSDQCNRFCRRGIAGAAATIRKVLKSGLDWLVAHQNPDGSWGGPGHPGPYDEFWSNITTHEAWIEATTGLAVMTLREHAEDKDAIASAARGLEFLIDRPAPKRPSDWDTDNTWGAIYGLEALATCLKAGEPADKTRQDAARQVRRPSWRTSATTRRPGGWGYYDFRVAGQAPS
jgi:hypothetical protein